MRVTFPNEIQVELGKTRVWWAKLQGSRVVLYTGIVTSICGLCVTVQLEDGELSDSHYCNLCLFLPEVLTRAQQMLEGLVK